LLHHPDKGGDEAQFKEIGEAYAVLSDPQKKMRYDRGDDLDGPEGIDVSQMFAQSGGFGGFGGGGGFPGGGYGGGYGGGGPGGVHVNVEVSRDSDENSCITLACADGRGPTQDLFGGGMGGGMPRSSFRHF
jgi:DnaJ-class molecular chaperone